MLGPIGVECRSKRSSSSDLQDSWLVLSTVFTVLTWCSMKLLDLEKCGDEVIWLVQLCCRNCASSIEANGGPMLV